MKRDRPGSVKERFDRFPFDLLRHLDFPRPLGARIRALRPWCMIPPYPWGHWTYGRLATTRCRRLAGDFAELGVGLGGTSVFLGELAKTSHKRMWSLDSFRGLPAPAPAHDNPYFHEGEYGPRMPRPRTLREDFDELVRRHGLKSTIRVREGFFEDTLPALPTRLKLSFLHIDADVYPSVLQALTGLYDRVVDGGIVAIDDFFHHGQGPLRAAQDFFRERRVQPVFHVVLPYSVVLVKGERAAASTKRSVDGNVYDLDLLRGDAELRGVVRRSLRAARGTPAEDHAALFHNLLRQSHPASGDVYAFLLALSDFWDLFDGTPDRRRAIKL